MWINLNSSDLMISKLFLLLKIRRNLLYMNIILYQLVVSYTYGLKKEENRV